MFMYIEATEQKWRVYESVIEGGGRSVGRELENQCGDAL